MKTKVLWALVALNVLLLVGLVAPLGRSPANAQAAGGKVARPGDNLLMITGEVIGGNSAMVYIIDETTNQLNARTYNDVGPNRGLRDVELQQPIDLDEIYQKIAQRNGGGPVRGAH